MAALSVGAEIIAIWMPVFNGEKHIAKAIESVLAQTFTDFQLLISDNKSSDGTADTLARCAGLDRRVISVCPHEHLAGIPHMKFCWDLVAGLKSTYSVHIGHHDIWPVNYLETLVGRMDAELEARRKTPGSPTVAIVVPECWQLDETDRPVGKFQDIMQLGQMPRHIAPHFAILGVNSPHLFGLWNEEVRRRVPLRHCCGGWDHLVVMHAAIYGAILFEQHTAVYLRGPPPTQGMDVYGQRHLSKELLAAGPTDFLQQLEWYSHVVAESLETFPDPSAIPMFNMLSQVAAVCLYTILRGQNLHAVPGAMAVFNESRELKELFGGVNFVAQKFQELLATAQDIND